MSSNREHGLALAPTCETSAFLMRAYGISLSPERAAEVAATAERLCRAVQEARRRFESDREPSNFAVTLLKCAGPGSQA